MGSNDWNNSPVTPSLPVETGKEGFNLSWEVMSQVARENTDAHLIIL